jgi:hypothetical protein
VRVPWLGPAIYNADAQIGFTPRATSGLHGWRVTNSGIDQARLHD